LKIFATKSPGVSTPKLSPVRTFKAARVRPATFPIFGLAAFAFLVACAWLVLNADLLRRYLDVYQQRQAMIRQVAQNREQVRHLKNRLESARMGGVELQDQIGKRLNMRRPGEQVLYIEREQPLAPIEASNIPEPVTEIAETETQPAEPEGLPMPGQALNLIPLEAEPEGLPKPPEITLGRP
jgi:hypothetical protein